ncbi:O-antigen ligase family protein [Pseudoalteromonas sp. H105]|uniref:O-antigen ligase family protein n=1 Tax=Pseudoalteromonas sp. H105 TaxID=1348393 RepID=UPI000731F22E|nr:O-antigen ligase family protein [Pseudoalteromonas sp. H105]KTF15207.1 hypothetical protein ATS75_10480 [Pseudoalteromonas sp. H105]
MKISNFSLNFKSLTPILFFTTWPPFALFTLLGGFLINLTKTSFIKVSKLYLISFICFFTILTMSVFSSIYNNDGVFDAKNYKFFFYIIALTYGFSLSKVSYRFTLFVSFFSFCILLILQYLLFGWSSDVRSNGMFYLPDQNNSMIIISFLFPAVMSLSSTSMKYLVIFLTIICMFFIGSRAGFALVAAVFTFYSMKEFSFIKRFYILLIFSIVIFYHGVDLESFAKLLEFNSYSDQVRLTLWKVGLNEFFHKENLLFGMGYEFFGIYNHYLNNEMKHVHNIYLQVLFTTGVFGGVAMIMFFLAWLYFSFRQGNISLFLQVIVVIILGLVETVYSDSRVFVVICFFLGLSYNNFMVKNRLEEK